MKEAPKDRLIIAVFNNYPPTVAHWNAAIKKWASATVQSAQLEGQGDDTYFETGWFEPEELKQWIEIPEFENGNVKKYFPLPDDIPYPDDKPEEVPVVK